MFNTPPVDKTFRLRNDMHKRLECASLKVLETCSDSNVKTYRDIKSDIVLQNKCETVGGMGDHDDHQPSTSRGLFADQTSRVSTKASVSSSAARRKQLELEAAQLRAQVQLENAKIQEKIQLELIDKQLEANLAKIDVEERSHSHNSRSRSHRDVDSLADDQIRSKVEDWLDTSASQACDNMDTQAPKSKTVLDPHAPDYQLEKPSPTKHQDDPGNGMYALAYALRDIVKTSTTEAQDRMLSRLATPRDLPTFSGDCIEWLHFRNAYNESTKVCHFSDSENLWRLRKSLRGVALEAVTDLLIGETSPSEVMACLELKFGSSDIIITNLTTQLRKLSPLPTHYQYDLLNFSIKINNCVATIKALKQDDHFRNPELASCVISKLPSTLISKWTQYLQANLQDGTPKLILLAQFLKEEAKWISIAGFQQLPNQTKEIKNPLPPVKRYEDKPRYRPILTTTSEVISVQNCKFCKKAYHLLADCRLFKRAMRKDKWRFVKMHHICQCCLKPRHSQDKQCPAPPCNIDNCGLLHHTMLHYKKPTTDAQVQSTAAIPYPQTEIDEALVADTLVTSATVNHVSCDEDSTCTQDDNRTSSPTYSNDVMLKIVPVTINGPNGTVCTYALLDDGSSISMIDFDLASKLGLETVHSNPIKFIDAFGIEVYQSDAPKVYLTISGYNNTLYNATLRKVPNLKLPQQNLSIINNMNLTYLSHVKNFVCKTNVIPRLLIGEDNYHLIAPLEIVPGNKYLPYATKCNLGWSIHGCFGRTQSQQELYQPICFLSHSGDNVIEDDDTQQVSELNDLIKNSFSLDAVGISSLRRENKDHIRAAQILDDTLRYTGKNWEVGLPFKRDKFSMPITYNYALSRLRGTMRKFNKDPTYASKYSSEVNKLFEAGYARRLMDNEISLSSDNVWYLSHFGVLNQNKPDKLRLVFDAAGKVNGVCLNDYILTGPDLYSSLFGIMLRFRRHKVVIIGDIKDFFLRISIRPEDQNVLRFLWQPDMYAPLQICAMQSLIFGATCSPFVAQYIRNKNALKYEDLYPEAARVITSDHYMDDCVHSCEDDETAIRLVKDITYVHQMGGFEIKRWASNSKKVLLSLPTDALAQSAINFTDGSSNTTEHTLGLIWHPDDDTFGFKLSLNRIPENILDGIEPPTKAKMLSVIMSIYDIHGFLCPFIIKGKIIFQDVHRSGVDWKCHIQPKEHASWVTWLHDLKYIESLRIPRCYLQDNGWSQCYPIPTKINGTKSIIDVQLHTLCDASTKAYAAVVYLRFACSDGSVQVSFVAAKSRVSPLRPVSVPRLELQGALIAARLAVTAQQEHRDVKISKRYFWTDSTTVLLWIRSDPRSFKPYVAHRLGEIDELTNVSEWRYVPTSLNTADIATREDAPPLNINAKWFVGPEYLLQPETEWPKDSKRGIPEDAVGEMKSVNVVSTSFTIPEVRLSEALPNENNISKWLVLVRATARVLLVIDKFKCRATEFDNNIIERAKTLIIQKSQEDSFTPEINKLKNKKTLAGNSRLVSLTPYLDEVGVLRVSGRVDKAGGVSTATARPVILDGRHRTTRLLVEHYHRNALHGANEYVVNELRQQYWIVNLRPTVRTVAAKCLFCRYRRAHPHPQRMADLPAARLQHNRRPFDCCGVDFFGPMEVTIGRKRHRRYGMLFTCLTVRAVHIELTDDLTTDSAIMALRRMAARRGMPRVIYSDNGTNLRGADKEIQQSLADLNVESLLQNALARGVDWRFIAPGAPEMGGAWERMIRTVKTALKVILNERAPHPDTLLTLMAEVEALVNSRPITYVSSDPNFPEALTPNHFLIGKSSNNPLFGKFDDVDLCLKKRWRIAQRLTDMFWARWLKEYLPTLLPRQKWTSEEPPFKIGDYVVLVEPKVERGCWRHGIVSATIAGADGRVRIVEVRTQSGVLRRPVTRVALLSSSS